MRRCRATLTFQCAALQCAALVGAALVGACGPSPELGAEGTSTGAESAGRAREPAAVGSGTLGRAPAPARGEPLPCPSPGDHALPDGGGYVGFGRVVALPDGYAVVWHERPQPAPLANRFALYFQRLDRSGAPVEGSLRALAFDDEYSRALPAMALAMDDGTIGLVYKRSSAPPPVERPPDPRSGRPGASPKPQGRQASPAMPERRTYFARIDLSGALLGPERPVDRERPWNVDHAAIAWDPELERFGVVYGTSEPSGAEPRLRFAQLSREGQPVGESLLLDPGNAFPSAGAPLVSRGGAWALAFASMERLWLVEIDGEGASRRVAMGPPGMNPSLDREGAEYRVAWAAGAGRPQIHWAGARTGATLEALGPPGVLGDPAAYSNSVAVALRGGATRLVWAESGPSTTLRTAVIGPGTEPTPAPVQTGQRAHHGWPTFAAGSCAEAFVYTVFGAGDAGIRLHVLPGEALEGRRGAAAEGRAE